MLRIPFSTVSKLRLTNEYLFVLIAVMIDGIETYRYLQQAFRYSETGEIEVDRIVYETTFTDRNSAYTYFQKMEDIRLVKS